jgi:hypothetical protein
LRPPAAPTAATGRALPAADAWLRLLFLRGAVLEQFNYYYVQLIYDRPTSYRS